MNNSCTYFESKFVDYINGKLLEKDNSFFNEHFKTCENCSKNEEFNEMIFAWKTMDKWQDVQPSKNFMAKLQHEIVLLEEKRNVLWFRIDSFFNFMRVPAMSVLLIIFSLHSSISYASTTKDFNLKNNGEIIQEGVKNISEMKVSDLLGKLNKNYSQKKVKK